MPTSTTHTSSLRATDPSSGSSADPQGGFAEGDRAGMLLDLDAGWMRYYRNNGKRYGPGFVEGVTGPLVRAAQLAGKGHLVVLLPGAVAPEGGRGYRRAVGGTARPGRLLNI